MRVLLVEKNHDFAVGILRLLFEEADHVVRVTTASEALGAVRDAAFDLCVADPSLSTDDAVPVVRAVCAAGFSAPIVAISKASGSAAARAALDAGAAAVLERTVSAGIFVACVDAVLGRSGPQAASWGELTLDRVRRSATVGGVRLRLTPRSFALLAILFHYRGRPVDRKALLARGWPGVGNASRRTLDVAVCRLRQSLRKGAWMVETVPGGYRLRPSRDFGEAVTASDAHA